MSKWSIVFERNMRRWLRYRRGLIWTLVLPLAIFIMGSVFGGTITGNHIVIVQEGHGAFSDKLIQTITDLKSADTPLFTISYESSLEDAKRQVELGNAKAVIYITKDLDQNLTLHMGGTIQLLIDNSNPLVSREISSVLLELAPRMNLKLQTIPIFQKQFEYIDFFASAVPVTIALMSAYQVAGEPIVHDKEKGIWKRYLVTPVSNWDLVIGDVLSGTLKAMLATTIAYAITVLLIGYGYIGAASILNGFLLILISVVGWVGFSVLVASRLNYNSYYSIGVLMNMMVFATSGIFYPIDGLPVWLRLLSSINPLTYSVEAFRGLMLRGLTIPDLGISFLFPLLFSAAMIMGGILSFRRRIE